jgi:hypothetical protein
MILYTPAELRVGMGEADGLLPDAIRACGGDPRRCYRIGRVRTDDYYTMNRFKELQATPQGTLNRRGGSRRL